MTTISLTAREFASLVDPVVPYAADDRSLPLLTGVRVTTRGGYVIAAATDRYRAAFQRVMSGNGAAEDGFHALIGKRTISRVRKIFKASGSFDPVITLTVDDMTLTVEAGATLDARLGDIAGGRLEFDLIPGDYPDIDRLLPWEHPEPSAPGRVIANADHLAGFTKAGSVFGSTPAIIYPAPEGKSFVVARGDDFIAMIQPVRLDGASGAKTAREALGPWGPLLTPEVAPEPAEKPKRTRKPAAKKEAAA